MEFCNCKYVLGVYFLLYVGRHGEADLIQSFPEVWGNLNFVTSRMTKIRPFYFIINESNTKLLMAWFRKAGKRQWWRQSKASTCVMKKSLSPSSLLPEAATYPDFSRAGPTCMAALNIYLKQIHSDQCNTDVHIC